MAEILIFDPVYKERVWGGRRIASDLGRALPGEGPIGESWEIVDRPEAQSRVRRGAWAGATLREVILHHSAAVMGPGWSAGRPFPILVKWLDCRERLSLQVHPPAGVAPELGGEPKTENWYVAAASPDARLMVGLSRSVKPEVFERAIHDGSAGDWVRSVEVAPGDSVLVHSGQVHAIDAGCLILEIQQNSDTTYRIFDWGRTGLDGRPRTLHVAESLRSILWTATPPVVVRGDSGSVRIASCDEFTIDRIRLESGGRLAFASGEQPRLLGVVEGALEAADGTRLALGDNALLPCSGAFEFAALGRTTVLVTEGFAAVGPGA